MKLPKNTIVIEVFQGCVSNVYASGDQSCLVIDNDAEGKPTWLATDEPKNMSTELERFVTRKLKDLAR